MSRPNLVNILNDLSRWMVLLTPTGKKIVYAGEIDVFWEITVCGLTHDFPLLRKIIHSEQARSTFRVKYIYDTFKYFWSKIVEIITHFGIQNKIKF